jgi:glycosyltransferase involved in cell wall biosynthesis
LGRKSLKGTVIHLGTETPDLSAPSDVPERLAGNVDFVCVARFAGWKGQLTLVRAWAALVRRGQCEARLVFIGDGPAFDLVRAEADRAKLGSHVLFMGARPEAARYFNQADVAVLMSTEPEAFGLVLLEAMSRGLPVLASRMGGIQEIVADRETGLLVDPANEGQLVEAVETLSSSEELRHKLGDRGRVRWKSAFTAREMVRRYQEYFESMSK